MPNRDGMCGVLTLAMLLCLGCIKAQAADPFVVLHESAIQIRDPTHVLLIGIAQAGNRLVAVGEHGTIIFSDDNGATWRQAVVPVEVPITAVAFATPKLGWATGAYGVVLHSTDGGETWQTQITGIEVNQLMRQAAAKLNQAAPQDPAATRAARRAGIFFAAGPDKPFLSIAVLSPQEVIVFGAYRMCIRTNDAGKSWNDCSLTIPDPISHNLYDAILAGGNMYIVGESGDVFQADADGNNIQALASPSPATLFSILSTNQHTLLAFGVADGMFRSADGGKSWTAVTVPGGSDLTGGAILANGMIVVTSENGATYGSVDDARSFQILPLNLGMAAFGLEQAANGDLVFIGSDGVRTVSLAALNGPGPG